LLHHLKDALIAFGPLGVFLLALLDSCGVPLPGAMDVSLIYVAWHSPALAYWTALAAVLGSVCGNAGLFLAARHGVRRFVKERDPDKPRKFRQWFDRYGLVTVFIPALLPIPPLPLKAFVISAGVMRTELSQFLAVVLAARMLRYFGEAYLAVRLGEDAHGFLLRNGWTLTGVTLALGFVLFGLIWLNDRRRAAAL
jgi:membrane protein YqaA with SNARE-associated domain